MVGFSFVSIACGVRGRFTKVLRVWCIPPESKRWPMSIFDHI